MIVKLIEPLEIGFQQFIPAGKIVEVINPLGLELIEKGAAESTEQLPFNFQPVIDVDPGLLEGIEELVKEKKKKERKTFWLDIEE